MRNQFYVSACNDLDEALMEIHRPAEDVVSAGACYHARRAIENFLRYYLLQKNRPIDSLKTIEELVTACSDFNKAIQAEVESALLCGTCSGNECYCLAHDTVSKCVLLAKKMKEMVSEQKVS